MHDLVTGEAVPLELRLARLPSRGLAFALDALIELALLLTASLVVGRVLSGADSALAAAVFLTVTVGVLVGYPVVSETLGRGRTVGKAALGLRVVRDDGGAIRFRHALVRALLGVFVDLWFTLGAGAVISSTLSGRGKRVGDVLAGTVVIRERTPRNRRTEPLVMPPHLAGWAYGLDLSRLPDGLAFAAQQFLTRETELSPPAREALGSRLATAVTATVGPPPAGTPGAAYLVAVLAERRRREQARLAGGVAEAAAPTSYDGVGPAPAGTAGGFAPPG